MDFFQIRTKETKSGLEIYPDFNVGRSQDLMVRGRSFYAIWDEEKGLWSTDEYDVQRLVDKALKEFYEEQKAKGIECEIRSLRSYQSNLWNQFKKLMNNVSDNSHQLDQKLVFSDTPVKKTDYASRRLPYSLAQGDHSAWDEIVGTLYDEEERAKIEWAIGAVISGDSKKIQKFLVFYGPPGTGKGTVLDIIYKLFGGLIKNGGYVNTFVAKNLVSGNNAFATETFKSNPLVAIQFDGDLSRIEDNSVLNAIVSHEDITINEKHKPTYSDKVDSFLFMGTNKPVRITDAKSGIIRRLIDVRPSGNLIKVSRYEVLMSQVDFELGAIAHHCLGVYRKLGKNYYNTYRPVEMMFQTDVFLNFVESCYDIFKEEDGITLRRAYTLYKEFCSDTGITETSRLPQYKFRSELTNYFEEFKERHTFPDGKQVRSYFKGFKSLPYKDLGPIDVPYSLVLDQTASSLDLLYAEQSAQYATEDGTKPEKYWDDSERMINGKLKRPDSSQIVSTVLADLDTTKLHFVKPPKNHIVIDFDIEGDDGVKSLEKNLEAASSWPSTYAELSKSGSAVHLHYIYEGDVSRLASKYADGIEVKVFTGNSSLRRKLTKCNNIPVATINSGLPLKENKVLQTQTIRTERGLRDLIIRNLRKEIHPGTKPSIDFIKKILDDAYDLGIPYDVTDLRSKIIAFANNSTNQALTCLKIVQTMRFKSETELEGVDENDVDALASDVRPVFYDIEVYPNLFVICWKFKDDPNVVKMINPSPQEVEGLFQFKLVGFNNRRYDNHILYARFLGYDNQQLYELSQRIINGDTKAMFGDAYNLSYADIYDFSSEKKSLKKWQIELGLRHMELDLPWDQPVPEKLWMKVVEYCANDVESTESVFDARHGDFVARQILAALSGLSVNDTTQKHTAKIIFGEDKNPQRRFVYTDLAKEFPGYKHDFGKSTYRGEVTGEGGYVYAEPGFYRDVVLLDVASMHPSSIENLNLFGDYTRNFSDLKAARLAIKHGDLDSARQMLDGRLGPYLRNEEETAALDRALKIVINIVYGLTSAKFDNPFRDPRNNDNIVAKRGALFMIDLKHMVQEAGFQVVHIKTDSIKIPGAPDWLIEQIMEFGKSYGYQFEHEATYEKLCLVNDAVYVAKYGWAEKEKLIGTWVAVGAQFQHPYVFKKLFTHEEITFEDLCETKQVSKGAMYLDFDYDKPNPHDGKMTFVGRTGLFVPVVQEAGGGVLYRVYEDKAYAVTGTKGYFWVEAEMARRMLESGSGYDAINNDVIDMVYYDGLVDSAVKTIEKFGNLYALVDT